MTQRRIVEIDEAKCNGCGLCVPACAEGAIEIVDGKARLVADLYCDGLGACLGECPQDAISIVEREADPFDEEAVRQQAVRTGSSGADAPAACPGAAVQHLQLDPLPTGTADASSASSSPEAPSELANWPVQLHLVPPHAPLLKGADLLLVADCVPFALADFHKRLLRKRPLVIGCPKLDDVQAYVEKLTAIITEAEIRSLTVVHMEVPCCRGLAWAAEQARRNSGREIPLEDVTVSIRGKLIPAQPKRNPREPKRNPRA